METEAAQTEEGSKTAPPARTKKPAMEIYVPKKRQAEKVDPKSKPRPRYTDKARKNKKDKTKATETPNGEVKQDNGGRGDGDKENQEKDESRHDMDSTSRTMNAPEDTSSALEHEGMPKEEDEEGENWDSLFNDDGDCLDPNLMEEVRVTKMIQPHIFDDAW